MSEATPRPVEDTAETEVRYQGELVDFYPEFAPEARRGSVRRITVVGEDVLAHPCREVTEFGTPELARLIDDMFATMYVADGVGLAANQVGVDLRVFVYDCPDDDGVRHVGHILNPVLDAPDPDERRLSVADEGCLSVPGPHMELARPEHAVARGVDRDGKPLVLSGTGYFGRCLQHETDHLNGRLYIDRLATRERRRALKRMEQLMDDVLARREARAAEFQGEAPARATPPTGP